MAALVAAVVFGYGYKYFQRGGLWIDEKTNMLTVQRPDGKVEEQDLTQVTEWKGENKEKNYLRGNTGKLLMLDTDWDQSVALGSLLTKKGIAVQGFDVANYHLDSLNVAKEETKRLFASKLILAKQMQLYLYVATIFIFIAVLLWPPMHQLLKVTAFSTLLLATIICFFVSGKTLVLISDSFSILPQCFISIALPLLGLFVLFAQSEVFIVNRSYIELSIKLIALFSTVVFIFYQYIKPAYPFLHWGSRVVLAGVCIALPWLLLVAINYDPAAPIYQKWAALIERKYIKEGKGAGSYFELRCDSISGTMYRFKATDDLYKRAIVGDSLRVLAYKGRLGYLHYEVQSQLIKQSIPGY